MIGRRRLEGNSQPKVRVRQIPSSNTYSHPGGPPPPLYSTPSPSKSPPEGWTLRFPHQRPVRHWETSSGSWTDALLDCATGAKGAGAGIKGVPGIKPFILMPSVEALGGGGWSRFGPGPWDFGGFGRRSSTKWSFGLSLSSRKNRGEDAMPLWNSKAWFCDSTGCPASFPFLIQGRSRECLGQDHF